MRAQAEGSVPRLPREHGLRRPRSWSGENAPRRPCGVLDGGGQLATRSNPRCLSGEPVHVRRPRRATEADPGVRANAFWPGRVSTSLCTTRIETGTSGKQGRFHAEQPGLALTTTGEPGAGRRNVSRGKPSAEKRGLDALPCKGGFSNGSNSKRGELSAQECRAVASTLLGEFVSSEIRIPASYAVAAPDLTRIGYGHPPTRLVGPRTRSEVIGNRARPAQLPLPRPGPLRRRREGRISPRQTAQRVRELLEVDRRERG